MNYDHAFFNLVVKIMHCNLSPANILLHNGTGKIVGFELSRTKPKGKVQLHAIICSLLIYVQSGIGERAYMAPEILGSKPQYSVHSDMYLF